MTAVPELQGHQQTALVPSRPISMAPQTYTYSEDEIKLIASTVAPGLTNDQFKLFLYVAKVRNLDPLQRQIHAVMRNTFEPESNSWAKKMTIQTGIDGFRAIANRTGLYMPSDKAPLVEGQGTPELRVTVWVKKWAPNDRQWHEFGATAYYREFVQTKKDGNALKPVAMWEKMPLGQTEKCAEAKVLRRGWPEELGQIYVDEEMQHTEPVGEVLSPEKKQDKTQREMGTLKASTEPNRGHGNEGMAKVTTVQSSPVAQSVVADEVPAKQLETMTVTVLKVDAKSKAINAKQKEENLKRKPEAQHEPQPYFILKCEDDISIFVWDKHLFTAILKSQKKKCVFGVAKNDKGFITLEDIIEIAGVKFALDPETKDAVPAELLGMTQRATERMEAGQSAAPPNPGLLEISGKVTSFRKTDANGKPLKAVSGPSYVTITLAYLDADTTHDPHQLFVCKNEHLFSVLEMSDEEDITFVYSKKTDAKHVLWQSIEDVKKVGNRTFENG